MFSVAKREMKQYDWVMVISSLFFFFRIKIQQGDHTMG